MYLVLDQILSSDVLLVLDKNGVVVQEVLL